MRRLAGVILLAFSSIYLDGCLFEQKGELDHPGICGYVYENGTEAAIEGALVRIHFCYESGSIKGDRFEVETDSLGYFYLASGNCMGKFGFEINISKEGYDSLYETGSASHTGFLDDCTGKEFFLDKK